MRVKNPEKSGLLPTLEVKDVDVPILQPGTFLVRVDAAPVNPSDILNMKNLYAKPQPELTQLGFEGSGQVVATGGGILANYFLGKRVAITSQSGGSYSEYVVATPVTVVALPDKVTTEQGASAIVNPLTVYGIVDTAVQNGVKTIIHTAAASALGKQLVRFAPTKGVQVINVVRRKDQEEELRKLGALHILNSSDKNFAKDLKTMASLLHATMAFDAISGEMTKTLFDNMPEKSTVFVYGALSGEETRGFSPIRLIFEEKVVTGWWLKTYIERISFVKKLMMFNECSSLLTDTLSTTYEKVFSLQDAIEGIQAIDSGKLHGKILIKPSLK